MLAAGSANAIPPDTPITNVATAAYQVAGQSFTVSASDTVVTDAGSGNSSPSGISLPPGSTVAENSPGAVVGVVSVADADPDDTHSFSVDDPRFEVVNGELKLLDGVALDFETEPVVTLTITATDPAGASISEAVDVGVTNVNEAPFDLVLSSTTLIASTPGAPVGDLTVSDPDVGDSFTFSVDDPRFEVVGTTLKLAAGESLPAGTQVNLNVTVTDAGGLTYIEAFTITATQSGGGVSDAALNFRQYGPGAPGATVFSVGQAQCAAGAGGPFHDVPPPSSFGSGIPVPGPVELSSTNAFKAGDGLFVELVDMDADLNPASVDTTLVTLTTDGGDIEVLRVVETGANTGIFVGYLAVSAGPSAPYDCALAGAAGIEITADYTDPGDPTDAASALAFVDPLGLVFDSSSGRPIDGAVITIVEAASGIPATVFGDDGVSLYPSTVTTGGQAVDDSGAIYDFAAGEYRFPFLAPGEYRLEVTPPNRFAFPSTVADATLQNLPGAPFVLSPASRGQPFTLAVGPALRIDLPMDLMPLTASDSQLTPFSLCTA